MKVTVIKDKRKIQQVREGMIERMVWSDKEKRKSLSKN